MRPSKLTVNKIDLELVIAHLIPQNRLTIILVLLPVLLFSGNVLCDSTTPTQVQKNAQEIDAQLLDAIDVLEQKATQESQVIQTLNERIAQLEKKIAALNYTVLTQRERESNETIQIVDKSNITDKPDHTASPQPSPIIIGSATTHSDDSATDTYFNIDNIEDVWQNADSPNHLIYAFGGLLIVLMMFIAWRIYKKRNAQPISKYDNTTTQTFDDDQNPITSDERNALLVQKLAALRNAVEQGKQRREQE